MLISQDKSGDSFDPQFLTFRHHTPAGVATSGRSIYSHRLDYKSLQKYAIFDVANSQRDDMNERTHAKIKHVVKDRQLRTVKSQEKYRELFCNEAYNAEQNIDESCEREVDDSHRYVMSSKQQSRLMQINSLRSRHADKNTDRNLIKKLTKDNKTAVNVQEEEIQRNADLKAKLSKLIKNMKKEQRKQITMDQQISEIQQENEGYDREIEEQESSFNELKDISQQNMKECNRIIQHICRVRSQNEETAAELENLEESVDSSEISIQTSRQDEAKDRQLCLKLRQRISELLKVKSQADTRVAKLQQEIRAMEYQLEEMRDEESQMLKLFGFRNQNINSQMIYSNHNSNHSHSSQHNSSGSNPESVYYY